MRQLTTYEKNQLLRHQIPLAKLAEAGEMPVEYLTGQVEFCQHDFFVNQHVLIPRVETEELVAAIIEDRKQQKEIGVQQKATAAQQDLKFLEIGTGSGALGISLFLALAQSLVGINNREIFAVLTDISPEALQVAQRNWQRLCLKTLDLDNLMFMESDLLAKIVLGDKQDNQVNQYAFIVANLPYIPSERIKTLAASVKDFEPQLALDGGSDGLQLIGRLIEELLANDYQGVLYLEVDETHQQTQLQALLPGKKVKVWTDSFGRNRFAKLEFKS